MFDVHFESIEIELNIPDNIRDLPFPFQFGWFWSKIFMDSIKTEAAVFGSRLKLSYDCEYLMNYGDIERTCGFSSH